MCLLLLGLQLMDSEKDRRKLSTPLSFSSPQKRKREATGKEMGREREKVLLNDVPLAKASQMRSTFSSS
jgi:hypothetical protein